MTVGGDRFDLLQFHFHTPSEHLITGEQFPMEVHFVHRHQETGNLGVLGVMVVEGEANGVLAPIWKHLDDEPGLHEETDQIVHPERLLPDDLSYSRYMGSLTTPPCSEGVHWHVLQESIEASAEQIAAFTEAFGQNARPFQPINNRLVMAD